jgi:ABC-type sulfate/molybdate transport systems ATPase subunit
MSVARNIGYGLECREWPKPAIGQRVAEALALVRLDDQAQKYPHQLSGGQQQRVALARALAPKPSVLLLDEPLSALDAQVREELRAEIKDLQSVLGVTTVMVTHDQHEAMEMATASVIQAGVIERVGHAVTCTTSPSNRLSVMHQPDEPRRQRQRSQGSPKVPNSGLCRHSARAH